MKKLSVVCTIFDKTYAETMNIPNESYADEVAYRTAICFAKTQVIAKYGFLPRNKEFTLVNSVNYDFTVI